MEGFLVSLAFEYKETLNQRFPEAIDAWRVHAIERFPEEACGFVLADGSFLPAKNVSDNPKSHFAIDAQEAVAAGDIVAYIHSHTMEEKDELGRVIPVSAEPSKLDMENQIITDRPWGISVCDGENVTTPVWWGDQLPIQPLIGRQFLHGISDCYTLVRDWHRLKGIVYPEHPRDDYWWSTEGLDLYIDNFEAAGFERVYRRHPMPGDVFLCSLRSKVMNHAGVYVGNGLILHHVPNRLSMETPAQIYQQKMTYLIRHKNLPETADA